MEGFITACVDEWPILKKRKELNIGLLCLISYFIGLSTITNVNYLKDHFNIKYVIIYIFSKSKGGIYIFNIFNTYACAGWALLSLMFFECIAVSWFYGNDRFFDNVNEMIGYYPNAFWKYCWLIFTPLLCFVS